MEKIYSGKTLDDAMNAAKEEMTALGLDISDYELVTVEQPVKKLFGTKGEYKVKAVYETSETIDSAVSEAKAEPTAEAEKTKKLTNEEVADSAKINAAIAYITKVLNALGAEDFKITPIIKEEMVVLDIVGEKLGVVIGRRGETLDALQYLAILASNRTDDPYCRISVDCNGYREKREDTLRNLARRTAQKVLKQGRRITLEPMNPFERRIIHSTVSEIEGVYSHSTGEEPYRKVVISANAKPAGNGQRSGDRRDNRDNRDNRDRRNNNHSNSGNAGRSYKQSSGFSTSFEREYKRTPSEPIEYSQETVETEKSTSLFEKIEL